ncbi:MAG: hypothetical protein LBE62_00705 [Azonexus sp.]|jgi:hypothetical protein|nr:hypothetical protein [Azonexus sp.]
MDAYLVFAFEIAISIAVSLVALRLLSSPLIGVLRRVCPDEEAALFWQTYTKVMLLLAPLLMVLMFGLFASSGDPLRHLQLMALAALGGLLLGLVIIGRLLGRFVVLPLPLVES